MSREILLLVDALAREKNVDKDVVFGALEHALAQATHGRRETLTVGRFDPTLPAKTARDPASLTYGMSLNLLEARELLARARRQVEQGESPSRAKVEKRNEAADALTFGGWAFTVGATVAGLRLWRAGTGGRAALVAMLAYAAWVSAEIAVGAMALNAWPAEPF